MTEQQALLSLESTPFGGAKDFDCARHGGNEGLLNYTIGRSISLLSSPPTDFAGTFPPQPCAKNRSENET